MTNSQTTDGYTNGPVTMIAVPAGLGVLGAILYAFFWNVSIYLVGGRLLFFSFPCKIKDHSFV